MQAFLQLQGAEAALVAMRGLLVAEWAAVVVAQGLRGVAPGLWSTGSIVAAHGLSCSAACGIFPS